LNEKQYYDINKTSTTDEKIINAEIMVVLCEQLKTKIKYDIFDDKGYSSDGSVKLELNEETMIINKKGRVVNKEASFNKPLLVFFEAINKSSGNEIPIINPTRVIILEK